MSESILRKFVIFFSLFIFLSLTVTATKGMPSVKSTWTYEFLSVSTKTSDPTKVNGSLRLERISRGIHAVSGEIFINIDVLEGDSNMIEIKSFRSIHGYNDFHILPFHVSASHVFHFLNNFYKSVLMDTLKTCSDLPVFEGKFQPPIIKKLYTLNACQVSKDGLPNYLEEGMYKVEALGTGEVEYQIVIISEVTRDL